MYETFKGVHIDLQDRLVSQINSLWNQTKEDFDTFTKKNNQNDVERDNRNDIFKEEVKEKFDYFLEQLQNLDKSKTDQKQTDSLKSEVGLIRGDQVLLVKNFAAFQDKNLKDGNDNEVKFKNLNEKFDKSKKQNGIILNIRIYHKKKYRSLIK